MLHIIVRSEGQERSFDHVAGPLRFESFPAGTWLTKAGKPARKDKRGYYLKSDSLRNDWDWADRTADRMANLIRVGDWARLPVVLATLVPRFKDVDVVKLTRSAALWRGAYARLLEDEKRRRATAEPTAST